jgi:hypothetical protein
MFSTRVRLSGMAIGTRIGFAIGGFAPVVPAAVRGEGPRRKLDLSEIHLLPSDRLHRRDKERRRERSPANLRGN